MMLSADVIMSEIIHDKYKKKINKKPKKHLCVECKSEHLNKFNNETVCKDCGLVISGNDSYVGLRKIKYPEGLKLR